MATNNDSVFLSKSSSHSTDTKPKEPTIEQIQSAARLILNRSLDTTTRRFAEGTHHAVYAIGNTHVARCLPSSPKTTKNLRRDAAVQALAKNSMSKPEIVAEVLDTPLVVEGWRGNLDRVLKGVSLQKSRPTKKSEEDLAQLLLDLKKVDVDEAVAATEYHEEKVNIKSRVTKSLRAWEELVEKGHAIDPEGKIPIILKQKLEHLSKAPEMPYKPTFLHADINTENILIDPQDGSITGVLDWSDSKVGDPCVDFSGVIFAIGVAKAKRVGQKAGLSEVEVERGWLYTMSEMIRDLRGCLCGEERDAHLEGLLREEWGRVFEGTGLEGILRTGV